MVYLCRNRFQIKIISWKLFFISNNNWDKKQLTAESFERLQSLHNKFCQKSVFTILSSCLLYLSFSFIFLEFALPVPAYY